MTAEQDLWVRVDTAIIADDVTTFAALVEHLPTDRLAQAAANAAMFGAVQILKWWLAHGLDRDQQYYSASILQRAAGAGQAGAVRVLLAAGASLGGVPLVSAASSGSLECVQLLVEAGAALDLGHPGFPTPLGAAEGKGHPEIARYLLERGATRRVGAKGPE